MAVVWIGCRFDAANRDCLRPSCPDRVAVTIARVEARSRGWDVVIFRILILGLVGFLINRGSIWKRSRPAMMRPPMPGPTVLKYSAPMLATQG